jgi:hypothetical protein
MACSRISMRSSGIRTVSYFRWSGCRTLRRARCGEQSRLRRVIWVGMVVEVVGELVEQPLVAFQLVASARRMARKSSTAWRSGFTPLLRAADAPGYAALPVGLGVARAPKVRAVSTCACWFPVWVTAIL